MLIADRVLARARPQAWSFDDPSTGAVGTATG